MLVKTRLKNNINFEYSTKHELVLKLKIMSLKQKQEPQGTQTIVICNKMSKQDEKHKHAWH